VWNIGLLAVMWSDTVETEENVCSRANDCGTILLT
jgi:hypothetical protein